MQNSITLYSLILDTLSDPILVIDKSGTILHFNSAWSNFRTEIGFLAEDTSVGSNYLNLLQGTSSICKASTDQVQEGVLSVLNEGREQFIFECFCNQASQSNWFMMRVTRLKYSGEGLFVVSYQNITHFKAIQESQRIAAIAFETKDAIIVTDIHKNIIRVNNSFCQVTGYRAEDAVGRSANFINSDLPGFGFHQSIWVMVENEKFWRGEFSIKRRNGEILPIFLSISAIADDKGHNSHYICRFTDITVQKQAEQVLFQVRQQLENEVTATKEELERVKRDTEEVNAALNVMFKRRVSDKSDAQMAFAQELETTVIPLLVKLKSASFRRRQSIRLIELLEINLKQMMQSYGSANNLAAAYLKLTSVETQVASMVKQGLSTKVIAATLAISPETVSIHRKNIRKKLGLSNKAVNLYTFLSTLNEFHSPPDSGMPTEIGVA